MGHRPDFRGGGLLRQQKNLYALAEELELARRRGKPIRADLSRWLEGVLKRIACGEDSDLVLGVQAGRRGVRKDALKNEIIRKITQGFVAAATDPDDPERVTVAQAIEQATKIFGPSAIAVGSIRKNWNKKDSNRGRKFTLSAD